MAATDKSTPAASPGAAPGSNANNAETNADAAQQQPGGTKPATDATKPADADAANSVGGDNPNQQTASTTTPSQGTDTQGAASREAALAQEHGQAAANATVGQTVTAQTPGRHPSESVGYTPAPAENTGDADSDSVGLTQAAQRLVPRENMHDMPAALGTIVNIPPGSRPMMIDPNTGLGVKPPQQEKAEPQPD